VPGESISNSQIQLFRASVSVHFGVNDNFQEFDCFSFSNPRPLRSIASNYLSSQLSSVSLNSELNVIYSQKGTVMQPSAQPVEKDPLPSVSAAVILKNDEIVEASQIVEKKTSEHEVAVPPVSSHPKAPESRLKEFPDPVDRRFLDEREKEMKVKNSIISSFLKNRTSEQQQPPKEESRYFYRDLKQCPLPTQKFKATFLAGDTADKIFSIVDMANSSVLQTIEKTIAEITDKDTSGSPYAPKKDEIVLAKFDGSYYRGVVKARQDEGFLIHYIDYGNSATVPEQGIKKLDKKLMEFEIVVHPCYMANFPDEITSKVAEILASEDGIIIENATKSTKEGTYVARISGL
jgi:Tudor domain